MAGPDAAGHPLGVQANPPQAAADGESRGLVRGLWLTLLLSFGPSVSNSFARFAYALILPAMRSDLKLSYAQAGWLGTVNAIGYLAGAVLTWAWVRRAGNRPLFAVGMVLASLTLVATGLTHQFAWLACWRGLAGVSGAVVFICGGALSGNVFPGRPQWATASILVYFGGAGLGLMLSALLVPWLLDLRGASAWPLAWQLLGALGVLMSVASIAVAWRIAEPQSAAGSARWRMGEFLPEMGSYVCFGLGYISYMTFVIAWLRDNGGGTLLVSGVWFSLGLATLLAPAVWTGPCQRWPGGRPLAAVMSLMAVGAVLPVWSVRPAVMLASAVLFGLAGFSAPSAIGAFVRRALPKPAWGPAIATFTTAFAVSQIAGPVLTGWIADGSGSLALGLTVSALVLFAGGLIALGQRDRRHLSVERSGG